MLHEHAITFQSQLSDANLEYLVRKSNRLGLIGREVVAIYKVIEEDKTHLYFEVTPMYRSDE